MNHVCITFDSGRRTQRGLHGDWLTLQLHHIPAAARRLLGVLGSMTPSIMGIPAAQATEGRVAFDICPEVYRSMRALGLGSLLSEGGFAMLSATCVTWAFGRRTACRHASGETGAVVRDLLERHHAGSQLRGRVF